MSRTIRRTKSKKHNSNLFRDFVDTNELNEETFDKVFWRYHRDSKQNYGWACGKMFFAEEEAITRAKNKQELIRYTKNEDYEVVNHFPRDVSWE